MFAVFANIMDFLRMGTAPQHRCLNCNHSVGDMLSFVHHIEMKRFTQMHTKGLTYTPRPWLPRNCSVNAKHPGQQSLHPSKHHLRLGKHASWHTQGCLGVQICKMSTHAASLFLIPGWPFSLPERYLYIGCS